MPNKFWLYLAFGLPIVTREIKNLYRLPGKFVYQADDVKSFVDNVFRACKENSTELIQERINFAKNNTWEHRGKEFINLINKYIG